MFNGYKIVIGLLSYNRYEYLKQCLDSLKKSDIKGIRLFIIDDHSDDKNVIDLIKNFSINGVETEYRVLRSNTGHPNYVAKKALNHFKKYYRDYDFWGIIDNDVIFSKEWLTKLLQHYKAAAESGQKIGLMTAFNASGGAVELASAPLTETFSNQYGQYGFKKYVGGAQLLFKPDILKEFGMFETKIKWFWKKRNMRGWDVQWSRRSGELGYNNLVTVPSYVQHIGVEGMHSANNNCDRAADFVGDLRDAEE